MSNDSFDKGTDTENLNAATDTRGQWVVCVRELLGNDNSFVGPFHSEEKAEAVAGRLRRDVAAVAADGLIDVIVQWVQPGNDLEQFRDDLLADLEEMGYVCP